MILIIQCLVLALMGSFIFDCVHYILHVFEESRHPLLQRLGALHGVHHVFLTREMKIDRQHRLENLLHHVIPEYGTAVIGMLILSYLFFGWLPAAIVISIRTVMVIVYLFQKGEDFTHAEMSRVKAHRSLIWVGPNYHALHHVYVRQHYSSFVNIFDMIFGTNCQIKDRRFLMLGSDGDYGSAMMIELRRLGGVVEAFGGDEIGQLKNTEVMVIDASAAEANLGRLIDTLHDLGKDRLVPPEVWVLDHDAYSPHASYYSRPELTYRHIVLPELKANGRAGWFAPLTAIKIGMFFLKRGFRYVPVTFTALVPWNYFKFAKTRVSEPR